jgi:acyl-coenzyme A thioesterase PaaI-like protein
MSSTWKDTLYLRLFGLFKIPMIAFLSPSVVEVSDKKTVIKIPYGVRSRNHLKSIYFGAFAVGADLTAGFFAMRLIQQSGHKIALSFKDLHADFHKRAYSDVHFVCEDGEKITDFVKQVVASDERMNLTVRVIAYCPKEGEEPVGTFDLTLSLKKKS